MFPFVRTHVRYRLLAAAAACALALSACSSSGPAAGPAGSSTSSVAGTASNQQILPVKTDPINNTATAQTLKITNFMVENNVDPTTNKAAPDHLQIAVQNTGATGLSGFEVYYTFTDTVAKATESYYTKLPASFSIPAGGTKTIHFDNSGQPNHFPVNKFDLYHTSKNALTVTAKVSAKGAAPQTITVNKSAGGAETAD